MEFYIKTLDFLERVMNGVMAIDPGQQPFISQDLEELNEMRDSLLKVSGQAERSHEDKAALPLQSVTNPLFAGVDLATVDAEYMIGYDTYDDDQCSYVLARKVDGVTEILLNKTCRIRNKADKDQFEADVNKLAEYFNCEVRCI